MKNSLVLRSTVSPTWYPALVVWAASFFAAVTVLAQGGVVLSGGIQIVPNPPPLVAPALLPSAPPLLTPLQVNHIPKRTPQFEIWRDGDAVPSRPTSEVSRNNQMPVRIAAGNAFAVRLALPGLAVGTTVFTQGIGHLKLIDSPDIQPVAAPTDAHGFVTVVLMFAETGREGALVVSVEGVRTVLRLRRNSP